MKCWLITHSECLEANVLVGEEEEETITNEVFCDVILLDDKLSRKRYVTNLIKHLVL